MNNLGINAVGSKTSNRGSKCIRAAKSGLEICGILVANATMFSHATGILMW